MKRVIVLFLLFFLINAVLVKAEKTTIYFFHSENCPHCAAENDFLDKIEPNYPDLDIKRLDVGETENSELWRKMAEAYGTSASGVPITFIGDKYVLGFGDEDTTGVEIEQAIQECVQTGCVDPLEKTNSIDHEDKHETNPFSLVMIIAIGLALLGVILITVKILGII